MLQRLSLRLGVWMTVACAVGGAIGSASAAVDCVAPKSRIQKEICASSEVRVAVEAFDAAFAEASTRAPDRSNALRAIKRTWDVELEKGCIMPNRDAFDRCILAQYRIRSQELALLVPKTEAVPGESAVKPGAYISDFVIFRLSQAGEFEMTDLSRSHQANGHYTVNSDALTLLDGTGDIGSTKFPLKCQVVKTANGFAVKLGQPQCRQLEGISFRNAS